MGTSLGVTQPAGNWDKMPSVTIACVQQNASCCGMVVAVCLEGEIAVGQNWHQSVLSQLLSAGGCRPSSAPSAMKLCTSGRTLPEKTLDVVSSFTGIRFTSNLAWPMRAAHQLVAVAMAKQSAAVYSASSLLGYSQRP